MKQISKHISYKEATHSNTAISWGIDNTPTQDQLINIGLLATNIFEPLREHVSEPIKINSLFRSKEVNEKVGGSYSSQHLCNNGAAIDIDDTYCTWTNLELGLWIKENLTFDMLIFEFMDEAGDVKWIHCSYKHTNNRNQVFIAYRENGETTYLDYSEFEYLLGI